MARLVEFSGAARRHFLEGDGAGENAAVDFRQHDIHGEIGAIGAARGGLPRVMRGGGERDLQHGRIGEIEHGAGVASCGKGGGVDHHIEGR